MTEGSSSTTPTYCQITFHGERPPTIVKFSFVVSVLSAKLKPPGGLFCKHVVLVKCPVYINPLLAGKCNPFVEAFVDGKSSVLWKTETLKKTWEPKWSHEEFEM